MKTTPQNRATLSRREYPAIEPLESRIAPATIVVTSLADTHVAGKTDLREALAMADTDLAAHPGVVNTIKFNLPAAAAHTENVITLGGTALSTGGDVNIVGPGAGKLIINGNNASGVFSIGGTTGVTTISGLSIANGNLGNGGGGIYCTESLTLKNVVISGNNSTSFGAGVNIHGSSTVATNLTIANSQITGNSRANIDSTGIYLSDAGSLKITNSVISGNARGVGISFSGVGAASATVLNTVISGNAADGIAFLASGPTNKFTISGTKIVDNGDEGAIIGGGTAVITGSTIENNTATYVGGGVNATSVTSLTITKSSIIGNKTTTTNAGQQGGGGIFLDGTGLGTPAPVKIAGSLISDNSSAEDGGGIFAENGIALTVTGSKLAGNRAAGAGGGIATRGITASGDVNLSVTGSLFSGNVANRGAAIAAEGTTALEGNGTFSIANSQVTGNTSLGADGGILASTSAAVTITNTMVTNNTSASFGGGLDFSFTQLLKITGGSVSDNTALGVGGGVRLFGVMGTIKNTTITGNVSTSVGGGLYLNGAGPVKIESNNIFGNTATGDPDFDGAGFVFA